jgi:hypothetical protein
MMVKQSQSDDCHSIIAQTVSREIIMATTSCRLRDQPDFTIDTYRDIMLMAVQRLDCCVTALGTVMADDLDEPENLSAMNWLFFEILHGEMRNLRDSVNCVGEPPEAPEERAA